MAAGKEDLVLVPGSLCDERVWRHQRADLADLATITVPSLHGHPSLAKMAEAVLQQAPPHFALAGFSMGGRVALEMLRHAPERITRLALLDSSIHPVADGEAERRSPQIEMALTEGMAALVRWWNPKIAHPSMRDNAEFMALLDDMACGFSPQDYAQEANALLTRPDPRPLLGQIRVPVLVLAGEDDPISGRDRNEAMAAAIPGARLVIIPGTGHFPMLEKPAVVSAALREWLLA